MITRKERISRFRRCNTLLYSILESKWTQVIIIFLAIAKALLNVFLILIALDYLVDKNAESDDEKRNSLKAIQVTLFSICLCIVSIFMLEILLRILCRQLTILDEKLEVFDCFTVLVTFVLYVSFYGALRSSRENAYGCGLLILLRLWRFNKCRQTFQRKHKKRNTYLKCRLENAELRLKTLNGLVLQQRREIEQLKRIKQFTDIQNLQVQYLGSAPNIGLGAVISSTAPSATSEVLADAVTSTPVCNEERRTLDKSVLLVPNHLSPIRRSRGAVSSGYTNPSFDDIPDEMKEIQRVSEVPVPFGSTATIGEISKLDMPTTDL